VDEEGWEALLKELKLIEVDVLGACSLFKYGGFPLMRMPPWALLTWATWHNSWRARHTARLVACVTRRDTWRRRHTTQLLAWAMHGATPGMGDTQRDSWRDT